MRFSHWLRPLAAQLDRSPSRPTPRRLASRPRLEALEDRATPAALPTPSGLVSWWAGDGSAADLAGVANATALNGVAYGTGRVGQAFNFDGNNDLIDVGGSRLIAGARTVEAWVRPAANTGYGLPILTGGTSGSGDFFGIAGTTGTAPVGQYELYVDHWGFSGYDSNLAVTPGEWSHVAMTYDGTTVRFYVNGVAGSAVAGTLYDYNINTYDVGGNRIGGTTTKASMNGLLDEVTLYDRALSASEIQSIYNAGGDGKVKPYMIVNAGAPVGGEVVTTAPTTFTVDFSHPFTAASLQPGDFTVNGAPADSVLVIDDNTAQFGFAASPAAAQGQHAMSMAAGSVTASGSVTEPSLRAWTGTFWYDEVPLQVVSSSPVPLGLITLPGATLRLDFNEAVAAGSVGLDDLTLSQGTVTGFSVSGDGTSITYTLGGLSEGPLAVSVAAGALTDVYGNPLTAGFAAEYDVDIGTAPFAGTFQPVSPAGSLVYQGSISGQFNSPVSPFVSAGLGGLIAPVGLLFGPDGHLYVPARDSDAVHRYDGTTGVFLDRFAYGGGLDGALYAHFGTDGKLYVSGEYSNTIVRYDGTTGAFLDVFVTAGSGGLSRPHDFAWDSSGNLYVSSYGNNQILKYSNSGAFLGVFVAAGSGGLAEPHGLTVGPGGDLYVSSSLSDQVLRYNGSTGAFLGTFVAAGSGGLDRPTALAFRPDGFLYVTSHLSRSVLRYSATTGAYADAYVPSGAAGLGNADGLAFDASGRVYVSSFNTHEVFRFDGTSGGPGDIDSYTVALDANQALALRITSAAAPTLTLTHSVLGPVALGPDLDPGPGLLYQPVQFKDGSGNPVAGMVTISVQAANGLTVASYSIQATINAQFDTGSDGSAPAQSLAPSTLDVEPSSVVVNRAAALGSLEKAVARITAETEGVANNLRGSWDQVGTSTTWRVNNAAGVTGSLNFSGSPNSNKYDSSDSYTFSGRAGDVVTLRTRGSNSGGGTLTATTLRLQGSGVQVNGTAVAGAASDALIQSFTLPATGTYTVIVGTDNGKKGTYTLTADLVTPVNPRPNTADVYSIDVAAGQYLSVAAATGGVAVSSAKVQLALYAPGVDPLTGTALKTSSVIGSLDALLEHQAAAAGTYKVKVIGATGLTAASVDYTLVAVANGSFDNTANGTFALAQDITGRPGAVGHLSPSVSTFITAGSGGVDEPQRLTFGPDGNLYVASYNTDRVLRYNGTTGAYIGVFVAAGSGGLDQPVDVVFGPDGNLYVASSATDQVLRYNGTTGAFLGVFVAAGNGLDRPTNLVFRGGDLYVAGFYSDNVLRYNGTTGAFVGAFVASGSGGMDGPNALAFGSDGNLYVAAGLSGNVLRYDGATGAFLGEFVPRGSGGLQDPTYAVFRAGHLYVSNRVGNDVLRYDASTGAFVDAYVPAGAGGLNDTEGLAFGPDGSLYVCSSNTDTVLRRSLALAPDYYKVTLTAGQTVTFSTSTPGDGAGQPTNELDPRLELFNSSQALVASGTVLADGRNEAITYTVPTSGTYYVKVSGQGPGEGDYVLDPVESGGNASNTAAAKDGWASPPVWLYGEGTNLRVGGTSRNLLLGSTGADRIGGNVDDDILLAGVFSHESDATALYAIMREWTRTDQTGEQRVTDLRDGGGLNETVVLNATMLANDLDADVPTGTSSYDWFLLDSTRDRATDLTDEAFTLDLPFING